VFFLLVFLRRTEDAEQEGFSLASIAFAIGSLFQDGESWGLALR
jgi:hypothetical protein